MECRILISDEGLHDVKNACLDSWEEDDQDKLIDSSTLPLVFEYYSDAIIDNAWGMRHDITEFGLMGGHGSEFVALVDEENGEILATVDMVGENDYETIGDVADLQSTNLYTNTRTIKIEIMDRGYALYTWDEAVLAAFALIHGAKDERMLDSLVDFHARYLFASAILDVTRVGILG